ncbi:MAG: hypothetical protein IIC58_07225 [Proteobacteria bacterium]|nr:hypothetical protein [Pseudomonadota bacterium]
MKKMILTGTLIIVSLGFTSASWAFSCPGHFKASQATIDSATTAMKAMTDKGKAGLVHTLLDDAKMLLNSAKHHHEKPAAGGYDHARALAKADSAKAYAEAAEVLAKR